ncbi:MAG: mechanosensitive ion channel protein MscS [Candidatus Pacebacteria bacterium CG10_big_fil_rev_8_21_14_0_10_56_10]|nr:MAG: mechanosensitive ion channel protein MscS [Candidatus Pacebacteria bacterium CG10_big_fil_rev_8_21_14_0_10_56_10]
MFGQSTVVSAVISATALLVGLLAIKKIAIGRLQHISRKTQTDLDDLVIDSINRIGWPVYVVVPILVAAQQLRLSGTIRSVLEASALIILVFYAVYAFQYLLVRLLHRLLRFHQSQGQQVDQTVTGFLELAVRILLWGLAVIVVLQNLGFNVTALLGGLGIAGLAVGIALQNVLVDVFSFFSIYFDKPFETGDFIVIGDEAGTVERVGLKSTRIRTLQGQELVMSNAELTSKHIHNYRHLKKRRVVMEFGVTYQTPVNQLKKVPETVAKIVEGIDHIELGRIHLKALADANLTYELVYFVLNNEYDVYMDAQQQLNLRLLEKFAQHKIEFAYPTQTIHLEK